LVAVSEADLPQGIRLNTPEGFSFEGLLPGEGVICRGGLLRFEHSSLTIDLRRARRWRCNLFSLGADINNPAVEVAWRSVWQALNDQQARSGSEIIAEDLFHPQKTWQPATARKVGEITRDLVNATRRYDPIANKTVVGLIGLGTGLTPSGDDLLVGYLAGLWCTASRQGERVKFLSCLGKSVIRLSRRTNDISRTYLVHAARGQVSNRLAALAEAICQGESPDRLLETTEAATHIGHTSGTEAVTGLLIGLAAWASDLVLMAHVDNANSLWTGFAR